MATQKLQQQVNTSVIPHYGPQDHLAVITYIKWITLIISDHCYRWEPQLNDYESALTLLRITGWESTIEATLGYLKVNGAGNVTIIGKILTAWDGYRQHGLKLRRELKRVKEYNNKSERSIGIQNALGKFNKSIIPLYLASPNPNVEWVNNIIKNSPDDKIFESTFPTEWAHFDALDSVTLADPLAPYIGEKSQAIKQTPHANTDLNQLQIANENTVTNNSEQNPSFASVEIDKIATETYQAMSDIGRAATITEIADRAGHDHKTTKSRLIVLRKAGKIRQQKQSKNWEIIAPL